MIYAVPCSFIPLVHVYFVYKCKCYTIIQITETEPAADIMEDDMDKEEEEGDDDYDTFLNEKGWPRQLHWWVPGRNEFLGKFVYVYKEMNVLKLDNIRTL